jgi:hypothetical protein
VSITDDEKADALRALTKTLGWEILLGLAREQMERRANQVMLQPLSESWTESQQEYVKGEYNGILTFTKMPEVFIEHYEPEPKEVEEDAE